MLASLDNLQSIILNFPQTRFTARFIFAIFLAMLFTSSALIVSGKLGNRIVTKTRSELDRIFIPYTHFENRSVNECRDFVLSRLIETDHETLDPNKKGATMLIIPPAPINPILHANKKEPPLINFEAKNLSATNVLINVLA